jgi:hypothetical protein
MHPLSIEAAEPLVRKHLSLIEWPETASLIRELRVARKRGRIERCIRSDGFFRADAP